MKFIKKQQVVKQAERKGKNWIIRPVKINKKENVLLICSEWDTSNYWYRYIPSIPKKMIDLLAVAKHSDEWLSNWMDYTVSIDDTIHNYETGETVSMKKIQKQLKKKVEELEKLEE